MPVRVQGVELYELDALWLASVEQEGRFHELDEQAVVALRWCDGQTPRDNVPVADLDRVLGRLARAGLVAPTQMPLRCEKCLVQPIAGELLVYHPGTHSTVLLNSAAAVVFESCDGQTPVTEVCARLAPDPELAQELLWTTLAKLQDNQLVETRAIPRSLSRRTFLERWGTLAAVLPVVTALAAPRPAFAASCQSGGALCADGGPTCCEGLVCCEAQPDYRCALPFGTSPCTPDVDLCCAPGDPVLCPSTGRCPSI